MNTIAKREKASLPAEQPSELIAFISMIERAARDPNCDVEKMERLLAMQERIIERNAKAAYAEALAAMQIELPVVPERGRIDIGRGKPQAYALWEDINDAIKPVLARHGFALSFRPGQTDGKITVTGVLLHRAGHSEETTMHLPVDASGSKNAVQAVGSSTSYGKRYTAAALLNLTSRGEDDDGRKGGSGEPIMPDQVESLRAMITEVGADEAKFLKYLKVEALSDLPVSRFCDAVDALQAKRGGRK